jgi:DNA polymerase-3 subunit gamma/tau
MCARVLLPGADADDRGIHARLDRLERRIGVTGTSNPALSTQPQTPPPSTTAASATPPPLSVPEITPSVPPQPPRQPSAADVQKQEVQAPGLTVTDVRRLWPEVLEEVKGKRRFTWILLSQNAQVAELRNGTLLLAMSNSGARDSFARGGSEDVLREAMVVVMGADFAIETMVDPSAAPSAAAPRTVQTTDNPPVTSGSAPEGAKVHATNGARNDTSEDPDALASRDDSDLEEDAESQAQLLARHLGAEIIAEEDHGA